jgi:hypothetical protein
MFAKNNLLCNGSYILRDIVGDKFKEPKMVSVIVGIEYGVNSGCKLPYRLVMGQCVYNHSVAIGKILPQVNQDSGFLGSDFCYAAANLVNTSMNFNFQIFPGLNLFIFPIGKILMPS